VNVTVSVTYSGAVREAFPGSGAGAVPAGRICNPRSGGFGHAPRERHCAPLIRHPEVRAHSRRSLRTLGYDGLRFAPSTLDDGASPIG